VLRSEKAIEMSVHVVRAFVRLRQMAFSVEELEGKLEKLEAKDAKQDEQMRAIYTALQTLMAPPDKPKRRIGFHPPEQA
jgi:hypothetical protein